VDLNRKLTNYPAPDFATGLFDPTNPSNPSNLATFQRA
jgi:hypothetical protein